MTSELPAKPTLLLVDDQILNIQVLHQIFKDEYTVCMATGGAQAMAFCARQLPDLILLDVVMPDMDGHQVCTALKADPRTHDIPIIFVTGHSNPEEETAGLQLGAVDFISKPVNASVVRARVRAHLLLRQSLHAVQELNDTLEARVARRTAELERALERLHQSQEDLAHSEARATLSTLIASVSHEMGTPLGNSKMVASTLAEQTAAMRRSLDGGQMRRSELTQYLDATADGIALLLRNLKRAVELMGDFRQVAADQASEQRRAFDLAAVVNETLHTLSPSLKRHPHRVVVEIPEGIAMDSLPGPLGQIVINLVNNAYLHAFEGRSDGVLRIQATPEGASAVRLVFADNGVGMAPELLGKLFQHFFSTKIGRGGTGLGMAIVHNLVTKTLGGSITVASTVGQGSRFELLLPRELPSVAT